MLTQYHNNIINNKILISEEHKITPTNVQCINDASTYLQKLLEDENAGLLAHELFFTVNGKLRGKMYCHYSLNKRCCEWNGLVHNFEDPKTTEHSMQPLMDDFNDKFWKHKQHQKQLINQSSIALLLSNFTIDFLRIHPFTDANGRTIKCMLNYILLSLHCQPMDFSTISYIEWCNIIHQQNYNALTTL